jgi:NADPH-dependent 2,4-dienoyl-CoA reductase/sulfur reductase-like enzyme/rhodanese-related sulfurtransferase
MIAMKKVVIIGGMAAGCKTAARLKRIKPEYDVTIIEKKSFLSYGKCGMPFYASGDINDFFDLAKTPWGTVRDEEFFSETKGINVLANTLVLEIEKESKQLKVKNLSNAYEYHISYDYLVIATGAEPIKPQFSCPESDKISTFHNPTDAKKFRELAQKGKIGSVSIIGGGSIGCELAEAVSSLWGIETTIIEKEDRLLPAYMDKDISRVLEKTLMNHDIKFLHSTVVEKIELNVLENPVVYLNNGEILESDYVFLCLGVKPSVELARSAGIKIGESGGIIVDEQMKTNIPGIWSGGDCVEVKNLITGKPSFFPLGSLANRQGRAIADSIAGLENDTPLCPLSRGEFEQQNNISIYPFSRGEFEGDIGTASLKVYEITFAWSGLNEIASKNAGLNICSICGTWHDRPDYHPDSKTLFGKIIYEKYSLRLLGLQLAGKGEVTRYIDAFSIFASAGGTAYDLLNFEHAYTPPHSSPMNPLNFFGAMIINQEIDGIKSINPTSFDIEKFDGIIIDVREKSEIVDYPFSEKAFCYTISELRNGFDVMDRELPILIICQKGTRSYEAARLLLKKGFREVYYLGGGVQLYNVILDADEE